MEFFGFDQLGSWTCHALGVTHLTNTCPYMEGRTSVGMTVILGIFLIGTSLAWRRLP